MVFYWSFNRREWICCSDPITTKGILEEGWYSWHDGDWRWRESTTFYRVVDPD